jgi:pilus assembly protein CpaD
MSTNSFLIRRSRALGASIRILIVLAAGSSMSGCYSAAYGPYSQLPAEPNYPNDYRHRHPITIREGKQIVEVFIGKDRSPLNASQRADIAYLSHVWRAESTGGIIISVPYGTPNGRASSEAAREVRSLLVASGIPDSLIATRSYQPEDPAKLSVLKVSYSKMVAEAGPCALWPSDLGPTFDVATYNSNRPYWNLGCANQRNLAAMVANPADLVQPRGESPSWTQRRTVVFEKYRVGQSAETNYPNQDRGKVSNVAR